MFKLSILAAAVIATALTGCDKPAPPNDGPRPVRTVTIERKAEGDKASLTGHVRAKDQVSVAFRLDGRVINRPVNVGDMVKAGQVVAQLDDQNQQSALRSAHADLASAEAVLSQTRLSLKKTRKLAAVASGWRGQFRIFRLQLGRMLFRLRRPYN